MAFFLTFFSGGGRVRHVSSPLLTQLRHGIQSFYRTNKKTARRKKKRQKTRQKKQEEGVGKESTVEGSE